MKSVLVTGACVNTGAAIVEKFLENGYSAVFTGRDSEKVAEAEKRYREKFPDSKIMGYKISPLNADGSVDEAAVAEMFKVLDGSGIFIETLVLNAADLAVGLGAFSSTVDDFSRVMNTNVAWNFCLSQYAAMRMKENGGGNVVFINSNTAYRAIPERLSYTASKGGQLGLMRALAFELGEYKIRVNAVLPGMIKTDRWEKNPEFYESVPSRFTPLGEVADGEDIANSVLYFAKYAKNTTGAELVVDGGNSIQLYPITDKK